MTAAETPAADKPEPECEPDGPEPGAAETDRPAPSTRLRAADPADQRRRDVAPAGQVLAVMVATLLLAAGLNSGAMLRSTEAGPLGSGRDLSLAFWRPVNTVSRHLGLNGPRDGLEALRRLGDSGSEPGDGSELVAGLPAEPADPSGPSADQGQEQEPAPTGSTAPIAAPTPDSTTADGALPFGPTDPVVGPVTTSPTATSPTATGGTAATTPGTLRRPTPDNPLRILLVGDSTMDAVGAAVLRELEPTGLTRATVDFRVSSGLARPDFFDWPAHLREARATGEVELVVILMGANDAQPFLIDGRAESFGTERWLATYRERVAGLLRELTADGGGVLWIGQPVMRKERFDADMRQIDQIYAEEVARTPRASYLDSRSLLADGKGAYAAYLVDGAGDRQRVRQDDGIHLTEAGAELLAPAVVDAINAMAPLY